MATRAELEAALNNPNARKFLDLLSYTEGTQQNGYATAFGGGKINDLSRHPRTSRDFTQTDGKKNTTTAAGRYQFLSSTWDEQAKKLGLTDFGAKSQDLAALSLAAESGALKDILSGNFKAAVDKTGTKWASLPSSPYPQGKKSWESVNKFLGSNYAATTPQFSTRQPMLNTNYEAASLPDFSVDSPSSIFGGLSLAPPIVQPQPQIEQPPIIDVKPIQNYFEDIWDNTDVLPQDYMNV
jgi:muramidase (phage lysozyme)